MAFWNHTILGQDVNPEWEDPNRDDTVHPTGQPATVQSRLTACGWKRNVVRPMEGTEPISEATQHLFYRNGGKIYEAWFTEFKAYWQFQSVSDKASAVANAEGSPSACAINDNGNGYPGSEHVFFRGGDGNNKKVYELRFSYDSAQSKHRWTVAEVPNSGQVTGDPLAFVGADGLTVHLLYVGRADKQTGIYAARWKNGAWEQEPQQPIDNASPQNQFQTLSNVITAGNTHYVYFHGRKRFYQLSANVTNGSWSGWTNTEIFHLTGQHASKAPATDAIASACLSDGEHHLFYRGNNHRVHHLYTDTDDSGRWKPEGDVLGAQIYGNPSACVWDRNSDDHLRIVYRAARGNAHRIWWQRWEEEVPRRDRRRRPKPEKKKHPRGMPGQKPVRSDSYADPLLFRWQHDQPDPLDIDERDDTLHIFHVSTDGNIHERWSNTTINPL